MYQPEHQSPSQPTPAPSARGFERRVIVHDISAPIDPDAVDDEVPPHDAVSDDEVRELVREEMPEGAPPDESSRRLSSRVLLGLGALATVAVVLIGMFVGGMAAALAVLAIIPGYVLIAMMPLYSATRLRTKEAAEVKAEIISQEGFRPPADAA